MCSFTDATAVGLATYGQGTGPIFVDNTGCSGTESNILQCSFDPDASDCSHREDAGVQCSSREYKEQFRYGIVAFKTEIKGL